METFDDQLCRWTEQVRRFLVSRLGSRGLSQDLAHEAAVRLMQARETGNGPDDGRAWMFRTARNLAIDEVRRRLPNPLGQEALGWVVDPSSLPAPEPLFRVGTEEVSRSEMLAQLPRALDRLPPHYRRMLVAHYQEGLDCESMAARERITVANAKVRLFRARRHLQYLLHKAAAGPPRAQAPGAYGASRVGEGAPDL